MNKNLDELWNTVLGIFETELSKANFQTLFKNTALLSLEDGIATIAAPSIMIIDLIQKRFLPLIKTTLEKQTGTDVDIVIIPKTVTDQKSAPKKSTPLFSQTESEPSPEINQPRLSVHLPRVRQDYTFSSMAVSSSNQLAFISATTVAQNPGKTYNPLFIYGPVGVGKTHLMQAIANEVYQKNPMVKIIYITSEEFTNEVVEAIMTNQTHGMKRRFRSASLLIIDDVQFIAGKEKVQEELFHTFNILIDNGSQIVLSSDRPPSEIKKLEKRLSSRFAGGLTVDIEPPDLELKIAILLIKAKRFGIELPIEIAQSIAQSIEDARSLEGALLRIITESRTKNIDITHDLAEKTLSNKEGGERSHFHPDDIIKKVCDYYRIKTTQIKGPKRDASLVRARQVSMYLLKKELRLTFAEIGHLLGGRDHTTIMHGVEKMELLVNNKSKLSEEIVGITKVIRG